MQFINTYIDTFTIQWAINCEHKDLKMTFCRWSPSLISPPLALDLTERSLHIAVSHWGWLKYTDVHWFKLGMLAGHASYTLAFCRPTEKKIPCGKITVSLSTASTPVQCSRELRWHGKLLSFRNELWLWSSLLKQTQSQQCNIISNYSFTDVFLIIITIGQHSVKKDLWGTENQEDTHIPSVCLKMWITEGMPSYKVHVSQLPNMTWPLVQKWGMYTKC
jgi:hypothetical protein